MSSSPARIPPIQCLLTFEAVARLRSATLAADELSVTPSAVSHRLRQLEALVGLKLFSRQDFGLTTEGAHISRRCASACRRCASCPATPRTTSA